MDVLFVLPLNRPLYEITDQEATPEWEWKLNEKSDGKQKRNIKKIDVVYPNGLMSIASYLQKIHPDVHSKILDFNVLLRDLAARKRDALFAMSGRDFAEYCLSLLEEDGPFHPAFVGISLPFSRMYEDLLPVSALLREHYPEAFIVAGGHLASASYRLILNTAPAVQAVSFGEGELPIAEMIGNMLAGKNAAECAEADGSWITRAKLEQECFAPQNRLIENLDEIPPYDFDLIVKRELYHEYSENIAFEDVTKKTNVFNILTTRGCFGRCIFCASHNVHGRRVRYYSVQRVKDDIALYREQYGIDLFLLMDDHFLMDKKRAMEVLDFMADNGIQCDLSNIAFFCIDENIAAVLKRMGKKEVLMSVENANPETLRDIIHKPGNLSHAKRAIEALRGEGLLVMSNILTGFPGETQQAIDKGVQGMIELGCDWYHFYIASPLPGSEMYDICEQNGYLDSKLDVHKMDFRKGVVTTPDFTPEYLERKIYENNLNVNFVNNYNLRSGNYERFLMLLERILTSVIDTHAFAYYYAAICAKELGLEEKFERYRDKYYEMTEKYEYWREWAEFFQLERI